jgi:hypothetical protein
MPVHNDKPSYKDQSEDSPPPIFKAIQGLPDYLRCYSRNTLSANRNKNSMLVFLLCSGILQLQYNDSTSQ